MKRTNVVIDEELLETARRVSGERTYSGTVTKALEAMVREDRFRESLRRLQDAAKEGPIFYPGYEEIVRPREYSMSHTKRRVSADEKRVPRTKGRRRDSR